MSGCSRKRSGPRSPESTSCGRRRLILADAWYRERLLCIFPDYGSSLANPPLRYQSFYVVGIGPFKVCSNFGGICREDNPCSIDWRRNCATSEKFATRQGAWPVPARWPDHRGNGRDVVGERGCEAGQSFQHLKSVSEALSVFTLPAPALKLCRDGAVSAYPRHSFPTRYQIQP